VLNIWSYLRLPDVCYPVVDLPCRNGTYTRWNNRPCSAAHPFYFEADIRKIAAKLKPAKHYGGAMYPPYPLSHYTITEKSIKMRLLTQDRNNPTL
jgi:hypothetical protein